MCFTIGPAPRNAARGRGIVQRDQLAADRGLTGALMLPSTRITPGLQQHADLCVAARVSQIARHRSGRSAGFAIVTFNTHDEAVSAMQALVGCMQAAEQHHQQ